jgi:hypothetical protein
MAMQLFSALEIPTPLGVYEIHDEEELLSTLVDLILNNLNTNTYVFKIDNEYNSGVWII